MSARNNIIQKVFTLQTFYKQRQLNIKQASQFDVYLNFLNNVMNKKIMEDTDLTKGGLLIFFAYGVMGSDWEFEGPGSKPSGSKQPLSPGCKKLISDSQKKQCAFNE